MMSGTEGGMEMDLPLYAKGLKTRFLERRDRACPGGRIISPESMM